MRTSPAAGRAAVAVTAAVLTVTGAVALTGCGEQHGLPPGANAASPTPPSTPPLTAGASPYVEPGAGDGAPHYNENNGYRLPSAMSPASAKDAQREAARIEPVLKRLWEQKTWDPATVHAALLKLGYEDAKTGPKGEPLAGTLTVRPMNSRYTEHGYVRPEGALVSLRVHDDACVTAFVQKTNYEAKTNGPFPGTGCFEPPAGH